MRSTLAGLRTLVLPWGSPPGSPHISIGPNIPPALANFDPGLILYAALIYYYDADDYFWQGMGTFFGVRVYIEGTYDPVNGVYVTYRVLQPGAGDIQVRVGSYQLNTFQQLYTFQRTKVQIGDGSNISDSLVVNGTAISKAIAFNATGLGTAETWHALPYAAGAGWANSGAPSVLGQYRLVASPPNSVQLVGVFTPGTKTNGTTIVTGLPAAYRPAANQDVVVSCDNVVAGGQAPHFNITSTGNINCWGVTAATNVSVNATYPLDA